jgi:acyl carrier protein
MTILEIKTIVIDQLKQLNESFLDSQKIIVDDNTVLFGNGSSIDSLSLVSVIVDLEMIFSDEYGLDISLTDDRAMTREISPFDSVTSLVDYLFEIINEKENT